MCIIGARLDLHGRRLRSSTTECGVHGCRAVLPCVVVDGVSRADDRVDAVEYVARQFNSVGGLKVGRIDRVGGVMLAEEDREDVRRLPSVPGRRDR